MITEADLLAKVPRGLYIDGAWIDAEGGATMTVTDPSNGRRLIGEITIGLSGEIDDEANLSDLIFAAAPTDDDPLPPGA
mgnify:CR=1 FL=1